MSNPQTLEALAARVTALEEFVRDMVEAADTIKTLAAQQARDLESYADQIRDRCGALLGSDGSPN